MTSTIVQEISHLMRTPPTAAAEYDGKKDALIASVNAALATHPDLQRLIGQNPLEIMYNNHENHANFMANVFKLNHYELLCRIVPWVYHAYSSRGFSYDYFPVALNAWIAAVENHLSSDQRTPIVLVYKWMIERHATMIELSKVAQPEGALVPEGRWKGVMEEFFNALLNGDRQEAVRIAKAAVQLPVDLEQFYLLVIQSSLYEIGRLWEEGVVSVAQEHLASAIVGRIMSLLHMTIASPVSRKGKAVVTSAPNEFHEIGAWMVADLLEVDGWEVKYLGANTPTEEVVKLLSDFRPQLLGISVTMPFNLDKSGKLIAALRAVPALKDCRVLLGGGAFTGLPNLWQEFGANGFARDAREAMDLVRSWRLR